MQQLGDVIRSLRLAAGVSQAELAKTTGMSASLLSMIETGRREPTLRGLRRVADQLGIGAGVLFAAALAEEAGDSGDRALRDVTDTLVDAAKKQVLAGAVFRRSERPSRASRPRVATRVAARIDRTRPQSASRSRRLD